ncbi:hypothetical protein ACFX11_031824 [Malus domestica]
MLTSVGTVTGDVFPKLKIRYGAAPCLFQNNLNACSPWAFLACPAIKAFQDTSFLVSKASKTNWDSSI